MCRAVPGTGLQIQLQLVAVVVAAAGLRQALVTPAPIQGQVSDQVVPVEDRQVITGGESQRRPASSSRPTAIRTPSQDISPPVFTVQCRTRVGCSDRTGFGVCRAAAIRRSNGV